MAAVEIPDWISDLGGDFELPEWVWRTEHVMDACAAGLPPHVIWQKLLMHSGLPFPTRSVLLWLSTYCGGASKRRALGHVTGSRVHCYPKQRHLAARCGASVRTVRRHLDVAEEIGWLVIDRHLNAPSDYWLAIPDLDWCPCGCESIPW